MPPTKSGLRYLKEIYPDNRNVSTLNLLEKNPRTLTLIRLDVGKSLKEFGELVGLSYAAISETERGKRKTVNKKVTKWVKKNIRKLEPFEIIEKNYEKITKLSLGGQRQAIKRAEKAKLTSQEKKILSLIRQLKLKVEIHKTFYTSIGPVNVDFFIRINEEKIIIEVTESRRRQKLESLNLRAIKLKNNINNLIIIAIVPNNLTYNLKRRLEDFDIIFEMKDLKNLRGFLAPHAAVQLDSTPDILRGLTAG